MFFKMSYFNYLEEQVAYFTALGFPGDMSHCSFLALENPGFSQGLLPPWSQSVFVKLGIIVYFWMLYNAMTRILFKFIIYPSCERALKKGRVNSKIVRKSSFRDTIFWLHMIIYDYFSSVFCIVPKNVLLLKYQKWASHLKNRYHYTKVVENARINFSISPYCNLLFSRKENFKFLEAALSAVPCNGVFGWIINVWGYQHWIPHAHLLVFWKRP